MKRSFNPGRDIARYIINAQVASDAGKGEYLGYGNDHRFRSGKHFGYGVKTANILNAIHLIRTCNQNMFRYYVTGNTPDQNGYDSVIVYFDCKVDGQRLQVSFHTPWNQVEGTLLERLIGSGRKTRWNKQIGGSQEACFILAEHFGL